MNYLIISDEQKYKLAKLVETYKNHLQVEVLPDNISRKIKKDQQILALTTNNIDLLNRELASMLPTIEVNLLADLIEVHDQKYSIQELSAIYFGDNCTESELCALLFALTESSTTFKHDLHGLFTKLTPEECQQRLDEIKYKEAEQALFDKYYNALLNLKNPDFNCDITKLLNHPDKHSIQYKALHLAAKELGKTPLDLCAQINLVPDLVQFFIDSFVIANFPNGIVNQPSSQATYSPIVHNTSLRVFSIDDATTTEIDDAFSITSIDSGYIIGVHISAPALDTNLAPVVANNISTVYYPGDKITMISREDIDRFSLLAGRTVPVVSIYFTLNTQFEIQAYDSVLESITIADNLTLESLSNLVTDENTINQTISHPYLNDLDILHKFAVKLEALRGKSSVNNLALDYSFIFASDGQITLSPRVRGNPIDKLVSELMILANGTWGRMLTNAFMPAIYRVKQPNFPVKMTTTPGSHTGLNVDYYTWSTSPLRRSADYFNQRQIISLITDQKSHYLATDPLFLEVVESFDSKYAKYIDFQEKMERYWSLRYLLQENITLISGIFIYKTKVQLSGVPLVIDVQGLVTAKPKGSSINFKITKINLANITFEFKVLDLQEETAISPKP